MRSGVMLVFLGLFCFTAGAEVNQKPQKFAENIACDLTLDELDYSLSQIRVVYSVFYSTNRDVLIDCLKAEGVEGKIFSYKNYIVEYETLKAIPHSSQRLEDKIWIIYYEKNKGYMPVDVGVQNESE